MLAFLKLRWFNRAMGRILPVSCSAVVLLLAFNSAAAADLREMKLLQDEQGTRAVLDIQGPSDYKLFALDHPERLVLDLRQTRLAPGFKLPPPNGAIANVRTGKPTPDTLRIVFDMGDSVTTISRIEHQGSTTRLIVEMSPSSLSAPSLAPAPVVLAARVTAEPQEAETQRAEPQFPPAATISVAAPEFVPRDRSSPPVTALPRSPARTIQDVIGSEQRKLVVAIDAGHGGKDPGALGPSGVREKNITLAVARELARQINADPGMRAVLIRESDNFVQLKQRYMRARAAQADLFISIHADASPNNNASGASVFVLSTRGASSQAARWLADKENAADLVGGVSLDQKDHNLAAVLLDLSQSATMRASDDIANQVLGSLKHVGKAHKPSIERANFVVLRSPDVPSMLIETGFITNPAEEQRLNDAGYRSRLAAAITEGVRAYFTDQPPVGSWYASRDDLRPASRMHVVSRGETMSLIAARHGVALDRIREANRRRDDALRVGESLTIPLLASNLPE